MTTYSIKKRMLSSKCCGIRSHKTHLGGHSRQWSTVYYDRVSEGNQFPRRTLMFLRGPVFTPRYVTDYLLVRESLPRQVDKKSGVLEEEEKEVWGSQGGDRGLEFSRRKKGQTSFFSTFLSLSHIKCFFL